MGCAVGSSVGCIVDGGGYVGIIGFVVGGNVIPTIADVGPAVGALVSEVGSIVGGLVVGCDVGGCDDGGQTGIIGFVVGRSVMLTISDVGFAVGALVSNVGSIVGVRVGFAVAFVGYEVGCRDDGG